MAIEFFVSALLAEENQNVTTIAISRMAFITSIKEIHTLKSKLWDFELLMKNRGAIWRSLFVLLHSSHINKSEEKLNHVIKNKRH